MLTTWAGTVAVARRVVESTLAASSRLRSGWPGGCPPVLLQPVLSRMTVVCHTASNMWVTVHENSLICTDRGHTCRSEAGGEGKTKSGVDSDLSACLISAHAGWHKDTWEGSSCNIPPCSFLLYSFTSNRVQIYQKTNEPKKKSCRNWDCFLTASRAHKMLRNTLSILTCFFLLPPLQATSLVLPFHSASHPTHWLVFIWNIKLEALAVPSCVGGSLITLKYLV